MPAGSLHARDIPFLEANYNGGDWQNGGARLAHMMNLVDWYAADGLDGPVTGETATSSSQVDAGTATVTIRPSDSTSKLFVRAAVRFIE